LLDQQFFNNSEFADYLSSTFVLIHADSTEDLGKSLFERFSIRGTPAVMVLNDQGEEIDRVTGYGPPASEYRTQLEAACTGQYTLLALRRAHAENPENLTTVARLARKHQGNYSYDAMAPFIQTLLQRAEESAVLMLPLGENDEETSALEYARFMELYEKPERIPEALADYKESPLRPMAFDRLWREMRKEDTRDESYGMADMLLEQYPDEIPLISTYIRASTQTGINTERAVELADHLTSLPAFEPDSHINPELARLYVKAGMDDKARGIYGEPYIAPFMAENTHELNAYAWFWALEEKNLDSALKAIRRAAEIDPADDNLLDTMSMVQWMMGDHQAAIATEQKALEMSGGKNTDYIARIDKIKVDMEINTHAEAEAVHW
jgi:tetratricopeptide (TPR) repeat protein